MQYPQITAVMVTLGRPDLVHQSYICFKNQTYPNKKLLIVTDGAIKQNVVDLAKKDKQVASLHLNGRKTLGELRNLSLAYASNLSIQWDDDDKFSDDRMMIQYAGLKGKRAVMLTEQLYYFSETKEVAWTVDPTGIEGTLLYDKRCPLRYPAMARGEDSILKAQLHDRKAVNLIQGGICYCRTYHGTNTWDRAHHINRIKTLGKNAKQMEESYKQLEKAAKTFNWQKGWQVLCGED